MPAFQAIQAGQYLPVVTAAAIQPRQSPAPSSSQTSTNSTPSNSGGQPSATAASTPASSISITQTSGSSPSATSGTTTPTSTYDASDYSTDGDSSDSGLSTEIKAGIVLGIVLVIIFICFCLCHGCCFGKNGCCCRGRSKRRASTWQPPAAQRLLWRHRPRNLEPSSSSSSYEPSTSFVIHSVRPACSNRSEPAPPRVLSNGYRSVLDPGSEYPIHLRHGRTVAELRAAELRWERERQEREITSSAVAVTPPAAAYLGGGRRASARDGDGEPLADPPPPYEPSPAYREREENVS